MCYRRSYLHLYLKNVYFEKSVFLFCIYCLHMYYGGSQVSISPQDFVYRGSQVSISPQAFVYRGSQVSISPQDFILLFYVFIW